MQDGYMDMMELYADLEIENDLRLNDMKIYYYT